MIDVLSEILPMLQFNGDDDFYYLQILQRKKENPQLGSNSRVIKNYYINNIDYLLGHYDEIKGLCTMFNARAMLRLNRRSYYKVAMKGMVNLANTIANKDFSNCGHAYDRAIGQGHNESKAKWIVDIDEEFNESFYNEITEFINSLDPVGEKILMYLPTKNGYHIITNPFRLDIFKKNYNDLDIHKDNPINLFIP
jgi:hypothetical protein